MLQWKEINNLGDHRLQEIRWIGNAILMLKFESPTHNAYQLITIEQYWQLDINLCFGNFADCPLLWEATVCEAEGVVQLTFDFAGTPQGRIFTKARRFTVENVESKT